MIDRLFSGLMLQAARPAESQLLARRREHRARLARHGMLIFLGQVILIGLVPVFDTGQQLTPGAFVIVALALAITTVWLLGYQRLTILLVGVGTFACLWTAVHIVTDLGFRFLPLLVFLLVKLAGVFLCIRQAFRADVPGTQRIYCGAASFIMLGIFFAAVHALVGTFGFGHYALPQEFENGRGLRWVDYIWFSFATLTTAGYSDLVPTGSLPLTVATFEGLCGILFPATLIARIASLPADEPK